MATDPNPSILIIDNDEDVVRGVSMRLESLGHRCRTACTGAQGLAEFTSGGADLVITDLNMPTLDGISMVEKIRATSEVPVIIMTGFRAEFAKKLAGLANVTVIRKPFDSQELVDLVTAELVLRHPKLAG